jgi:hypothetical protein
MFRLLFILLTSTIILDDFTLVIESAQASQVKTSKITMKTKKGTIEYEIHYGGADKIFVDEVERVLKQHSQRIFTYFDYVPKGTLHINVLSETTTANGSAQVFPENIINLNTYPPVGAEHLIVSDNWIEALVVHELAHIVHMDQTRGILKGFRTIFGSTGKLGGVVPRWFTEGLAVWVETSLTQGGRIRNQQLKRDFLNTVLTKDYCKTIDCLDGPNEYPQGQYPYWAGAFFMDFLEQKKQGTVSCLVRENSDNIPFFLNSAFKNCTQKSAYQLYKDFLRETIEEIQVKNNKKDLVALTDQFKKFSFKDTYMSSGTGVGLVGSHFLLSTEEDSIESLANINLENGTVDKNRSHLYLEYLPRGTNNSNALVGVGRRDGFDLYRKWSSWDVAKNELSTPLDFLDGYSSVFKIKDGVFIGSKYISSRWEIWVVSKKEKYLIHQFEKLESVKDLDLVVNKKNQMLTGQSYRLKDNSFRFWTLELDKNLKAKKFNIVYNSSERFEYLAQCQGSAILKKSHNRLIKVSQNSRALEASTQWSDDISFLRWNDQFVTMLLTGFPQDIFYKKIGCATFLKNLSFKSKEKKAVTSKNEAPKNIEIEKTVSSYPSAGHFLPHYWFLNYARPNSLDIWSAVSSVSDPYNIHTLNFTVDYYSSESEFVPKGNYIFKWNKERYDTVYFDYTYDKYFTLSDFSSLRNEYVVQSLGFKKISFWWEWEHWARFIVSKQKIADFISSRDLTVWDFYQILHFNGRFEDSFVDLFQLYGRVFKQDSSGFDSFIGQQYRSMLDLNVYGPLSFKSMSTYGNLNKDGFRSGVLYGGGNGDYSEQSFHEFYGLTYGDVFGNQVSTHRAQIFLKALSPYTAGGALFPFFVKDIYLFGGMEYIKADRILFKNTTLRDESLENVHLGMRVMATFAYYLPVEIDMTYVSTKDNSGQKENQFLTLFRGNILP